MNEKFIKEHVKKPNKKMLKYANSSIKKHNILGNFLSACSMILSLAVTGVFVADIFVHHFVVYSYIAIIYSIIGAAISLCFVWDFIARMREAKKIKCGDYLVAKCSIASILKRSARWTEVRLKCRKVVDEQTIYKVRGKRCSIGDKVFLVVMYDKNGEIKYLKIVKCEE